MRSLPACIALLLCVAVAVACGAPTVDEPSDTSDDALAFWDPYAHRAQLRDPHRQPKLLVRDRGRADVVWAEIEGPLFDPGGPSADDFSQHHGSDCYFLSTLGSLAVVRPRVLRNLITDEGDGTFTVHFADGTAPVGRVPDVARPIDVVVDRQVPWAPDGSLLYVRRRTTLAIWPVILEKAWAKLQGSYERALSGGHTRNAFFALAGWHSAMNRFDVDSPRDRLFGMIASALANHQGVTLGTPPGPPRVGGLVSGHAYTVFGAVTDERGRMLIGIRNPWGKREPDFDGAQDATTVTSGCERSTSSMVFMR